MPPSLSDGLASRDAVDDSLIELYSGILGNGGSLAEGACGRHVLKGHLVHSLSAVTSV